MFGDSEATPPHSCGHANSVYDCMHACVSVYGCVCVYVCVHAQEDQAADSWAKAQTLRRERDSEEESTGLKSIQKDTSKGATRMNL